MATITDKRAKESKGGDTVVSCIFMVDNKILMHTDYNHKALDETMRRSVEEQEWLPSTEATVAVTVRHILSNVWDRRINNNSLQVFAHPSTG